MTIRVSPDEHERLKRAAKANMQKASEFARDAIVTAASDVLEGGDDCNLSAWSD